ncbi:MAG: methionyl-tRNA formyltransferase [Eubacteriaceae bacterium]|nr:methionyl-tRNA formyltransferase [Eubacteriaceae bacterium]
MRIIYAATPDFAVPALKSIIKTKNDIVLIITQPDKANARGNKIVFSAVKQAGIENNIEIFQPDNINSSQSLDIIKSCNPDLLITAAYGQILKQELLNIPKYGCVNIHASLLPKYRGAAPINRAIINGESVSGITIMKMDRGMDTGDIIIQKEIFIDDNMTAGQLHDELALLGASMIEEFLCDVKGYLSKAKKQDNTLASIAGKITKEELFINFNDDCVNINNKIRGLSPYPAARCYIDGKILKIYESEILGETFNNKAGDIIYFDKVNGFVVKTNDKGLKLKKVQLEGKKELTDKQFIIGYNLESKFLS